VKGENAIFPAIGVNAAGKGAMTFTLVGKHRFPSAAYVLLDAAAGASDVHVAAAGLGPQDGFSGYKPFSGTKVARWGDYSAAVADDAGDVWLATEYIAQTCDGDTYLATGGTCGGTRTSLANWGTFIFKVTP